ncbi:uncharacterized protein LOC115214323 isoform X1 [Octopus sinensis]|uniref:Uncharacterized protein LOC115214323 isoform X1 n=1 Tax=Octopus sinensis TaxID=2607531 RepID=A0A6P7SMU8_9MOLL|nr:uncharacterized protein LOC115214323 isoform X1 [Octopus sinensis]
MASHLIFLALLTLSPCYGLSVGTKKLLQNFGENLFKELNQFDVFPEEDSQDINVRHNLVSLVNSRHRRASSDSRPIQQDITTSKNTLVLEDIKPKLPSNSDLSGQIDVVENNALSVGEVKGTAPAEKVDPLSTIYLKDSVQQNLETPVKTHQYVSEEKDQNVYNNFKKLSDQNKLADLQQQQLRDQQNLVFQQVPSQNGLDVNLQQKLLPQNSEGVASQHKASGNQIVQQNVQVQNGFQPGAQNEVLDQKNIRQLKQNKLEPVPQQGVPLQDNEVTAPQQNEENILNPKNFLQKNVPVVQQPGNSVIQQKAMNMDTVTVSPPEKNAVNNGDNVVKIPVEAMIDQKAPLNQNIASINNIAPNSSNQLNVSFPHILAEGNKEAKVNNGKDVAEQSPSGSLLRDSLLIENSKQNKLEKLAHDNLAEAQQFPEAGNSILKENNIGQNVPSQVGSDSIRLVSVSKILSKSYLFTRPISRLEHYPQNSQEFSDHKKADDSWYYNQDMEGSIGHGLTEKHAGKQMLMSAHHFDISLGALAGAKMAGNNFWEKNPHRFFNKKNESFEPLSMVMFYSWIALATLAVLGVLTLFRHRHRVTGYVYDFHLRHRAGHVEEDRRLLKNAYA